MLYLLCQKSDDGEMKETSKSHLQVDEDKQNLIDPQEKKTTLKQENKKIITGKSNTLLTNIQNNVAFYAKTF